MLRSLVGSEMCIRDSMPHSQQKHAYKSNTHKFRRNLNIKYNDNKKQRSVFDMCIEVNIKRRKNLKEFVNDNNDSKLTMLGGRLFQTLIMHINTTTVDEQFIWVPASCSTVATRRLQRKIIRHLLVQK